MIIETFRQAIQNVWSNKLRTFLTMLGIIIGVMAVIVIVCLGNGMTKSMRDSFSALGGVLGIALGYVVSMAANKVLPMFMTDTTVTVSPSFNSIVVAFGISVGIGVLFGYLPARRAARLNPIEALRYD